MKSLWLVALLFLASCVSKKEIDAITWANTGIKPDICEHLKKTYGEDRIKRIGLYRKLSNGKFEVIPYCSPEAQRFISARDDDINRLLKKYGVKN